jgi:hypothetical protein
VLSHRPKPGRISAVSCWICWTPAEARPRIHLSWEGQAKYNVSRSAGWQGPRRTEAAYGGGVQHLSGNGRLDRIVAFTLFGEVYVSEDAGASWRKIAREFGEIRAAVWLPN